MRPVLSVTLVLLSGFGAATVQAHAAQPSRPGILLIVADDLGYGDVGCYGATKIKTPNLDRLADAGVRLTDAHAPAAVCQPSRYAILSGTYFMRAKRQGQWTLYFHEGQVTLPGLLKSAGYRTAALGKWHLGFGRGADPDYNQDLQPGPLEIGFDSFFGCPRTHNEPPFVFVENHRVVGLDPADALRIIPANETKEGFGHGVSKGAAAAHAARPVEKIDLILADKAKQFIAQKSDAPFFLYLAFLAPHVPIAPSPEFQGTSQAKRYGDYVQQLDACVGKVLDTLKENGLADNTLVVFTSDNGAVLHRDALEAGHRANRELLGQKTDAWEGGQRVPFIARWPGRIPAGTSCDRLLGLTDIMATVAAAANIPVPADAAPDSLNQLPVLTNPTGAPAVRTEFLMQGTGGFALRQGDWVFLPKQGSSGMTVQVPPGPLWGQPYAKLGLTNSDIDTQGQIKPDAPPVQLYNLARDPRQTTNVTVKEPDQTAAMKQRLDELLAEPKPAAKPNPQAGAKVKTKTATVPPAPKPPLASAPAEPDFAAMLQPVPESAKFIDPDYYIWCGTMVRGDDGKCHLFYSRWPRKLGHYAWVTHSEVAHAVADSPLAPFRHKDVTLPARGKDFWDGLCTHNPTVRRFGSKFYLYYMGNTGDGVAMKTLNWTHRNNQRIGVAVADSPDGPWQRFDKPVIEPTPGFIDALCCANPTVTDRPGGGYLMVYKAVGDKNRLPFGGPVLHAVAISDSPLGPFQKQPHPVFAKEGVAFAAEDPFIWTQDDHYWAIVKDNAGHFTQRGKSTALFESADGLEWRLAQHALVATTEITWDGGRRQKLNSLERPQVFLENGRPSLLLFACDEDGKREHSYNIRVPLKTGDPKRP